MKLEKLLKYFIAFILLWGITIRVFLFIQNRDLIIDESNIARNLFERGFLQLAMPLSYEQYAPPVFLWIEKLFVITLGYSEYALRLYPLLAGIAALLLFALVMKEIASFRSAWYPLLLMVVSFTFIRYSSEVKQYMPDVMITLALIYAALKTDVKAITAGRFFIRWLLIGSVAIWASMPAIFALAGIGCYYLAICIRQKEYNKLKIVFAMGVAWGIQFLLYYILVLRPQANSQYLQEYHRNFFLFLIPNGVDQLRHNWGIFKELVEQASGYESVALKFNLILMITGMVVLFKNNSARAFLVGVPLLAALFAAALHQFSLIPRVALFTMPIILLFIGYGFEKMLQIKFVVVKIALVLLAFNAVRHFNITFDILKNPTRDEMITEALSFVKKKNLPGRKVYIGNGSGPAYIYYTQIHPGQQNWSALKGAGFLQWNTTFDSLARHITDTSAFLYTNPGPDELKQHKEQLAPYFTCIDSIEQNVPRCFVYVYIKK